MGNRAAGGAFATALIQQQAGLDMQRERDEQNMRQIALDHAVRSSAVSGTDTLRLAKTFYDFLRGAKQPRVAKRKGKR